MSGDIIMFEKQRAWLADKSQKIVAVFAIGAASAGNAMAALPTSATTAFTDLQTDALALVDLAWTAAIPITIAFVILGMFKRAAYSAT